MTLLKDMEPEQAQAKLQSCLGRMQSNDVIDLAEIFFACKDETFTAEELADILHKSVKDIKTMIKGLRSTHGLNIASLPDIGKKTKYKMIGFIDKRKGRQMEIVMPDYSLINQVMQ
jgi:hypothetical protein